MSDPIGRFDFAQAIDDEGDVLLLAAGTGLTPMVNLVERRVDRRRCVSSVLLNEISDSTRP